MHCLPDDNAANDSDRKNYFDSLLNVLLFLEMIKIVRDALDSKMRFGTIAATGITVHFAFVVVYNMACSFNLMPIISDIGYLPFLSFGNMNLIHWLEIGIIASIKNAQNKES